MHKDLKNQSTSQGHCNSQARNNTRPKNLSTANPKRRLPEKRKSRRFDAGPKKQKQFLNNAREKKPMTTSEEAASSRLSRPGRRLRGAKQVSTSNY
ncbi:hypothetical protein KSP39_PZI008969 [Platanthera zijinensis]|uniref:Uncharacterized protein n=1 Tax=Platanthera zijinensis TaxID=2320716 RepID=A0AAP0BKX9_9ASPA